MKIYNTEHNVINTNLASIRQVIDNYAIKKTLKKSNDQVKIHLHLLIRYYEIRQKHLTIKSMYNLTNTLLYIIYMLQNINNSD